jgi:hypothetical protein
LHDDEREREIEREGERERLLAVVIQNDIDINGWCVQRKERGNSEV